MKLLQNTILPETETVLWELDSLCRTDEANSFLKLLILFAIEAEAAEQ